MKFSGCTTNTDLAHVTNPIYRNPRTSKFHTAERILLHARPFFLYFLYIFHAEQPAENWFKLHRVCSTLRANVRSCFIEKVIFKPNDVSVFSTLSINGRLFVCRRDELDSLVRNGTGRILEFIGIQIKRLDKIRLKMILKASFFFSFWHRFLYPSRWNLLRGSPPTLS